LPQPVEKIPQGDVDQQRAKSGAWILDQRTRKGYRVADLDDTKSTQVKSIDANKTQRTESIEDVRSNGQFASFDPPGYSPAQIRRAYGFDKLRNDGKGQVIAIVSAYHYPTAAADLDKFSKTFGLRRMHDNGLFNCAAPGVPHPCFQVVYASSVEPPVDALWALESALDTQWAHAIAPGADIILVEAASNSLSDLFLAVAVAQNLPRVSVISMSWGTPEFPGEAAFDVFFNAPGVTFIVSSGDSGNPGAYPAASPYVIAVGGTTLRLDRKGNRIAETAWSFSGGGISCPGCEFEPAYQMDYPIPFTGNRRGIPDVSMNGDPLTGNSVYNSLGFAGHVGWFESGGTSLSAPMFAGLIALANQLRRGGNLSSTNLFYSPLYDAAKRDYRDNFFDIKSGSNGTCGSLCMAQRGYDFVTGLGSPKADELVEALAERGHH
jgi:subtilase family serine protease